MRASRLARAVVSQLEQLDPIQAAYLREPCIAVDEEDRIVGEVSKERAHRAETMTLHRAFSVFAFTPDKKLILQKRSDTKVTFPGVWTNTCCSHPLHVKGEMDGEQGVSVAARRKMRHEMGVESCVDDRLEHMGRFLYAASMTSSPWGEHEMDYAVVWRGMEVDRVRANQEEVSDVRAVSSQELSEMMSSEEFSPWFRLFYRLGVLDESWARLDGDLTGLKKRDICFEYSEGEETGRYIMDY